MDRCLNAAKFGAVGGALVAVGFGTSTLHGFAWIGASAIALVVGSTMDSKFRLFELFAATFSC
jgi:hypothetical protein